MKREEIKGPIDQITITGVHNLAIVSSSKIEVRKDRHKPVITEVELNKTGHHNSKEYSSAQFSKDHHKTGHHRVTNRQIIKNSCTAYNFK